ncbi:hypothetical protein LQ938_13320 [Microbacterium sp. cx-55]|uniref:DNA polymerase Y family protein n=1 Tax=Microbacterium sp. cx-55 TaxID=2875948 RepID=UPI001CBC5E4C|nr:hypothetical protein [Microbacterium sp. cx-55]MBZ4487754.1 hypothetical protein [Microbacterium sp. cx-55]UGB34834.1 hypothetical protein LQ938_13320 [Microbacterium sp. cx-55]
MVGPILHVDADSFFASVAMRRRPDLYEVPFAVVAHVYIASANYPARARGVTSGQLVHEAVAACPDLVLQDVDRDEVESVSDHLFDIFGRHAVSVEPGSLEEAFLDVGARDGTAAIAAARAIRAETSTTLGIPVSVGVARTRLMAKLASRRAKPDGIYTIGPPEERHLRATLPLSEVWGIGAKTIERLRLSGYGTLGELSTASDEELRRVCGVTMSRRLTAIRAGTDESAVRGLDRRTSLSSEGAISGFGRADLLPADLVQQCVRRVCHRATRAGLLASTLSLSLRLTSSRSLAPLKAGAPVPTDNAATWTTIARTLLTRGPAAGVTGVRVTLSGLIAAEDVTPPLF